MQQQPSKITNILLVDDDDLDVENVQRAFRKANVHNPLWIAHDGEEALKVLRGDAYPAERRVVLLDLNLPKMSGIEVLSEIRKDPELRSLSVVVLTTSDEERDREAAFQLNVAGYVLKPMTLPLLTDAVASLNSYWNTIELSP